MGDVNSSAAYGVPVRGYRRGTVSTDPYDQYVIPVRDRITSFQGRAGTFLTPGRAAVAQKILALHNATGSSVTVNVSKIKVDLLTTVIKAATVVPPIIRVHRFTAIPTNGTTLTKVTSDTAQSSNASVTAWQDASADGTSSGTTLTVTTGSIIDQVWAARLVAVASGYEPMDVACFTLDETLRPLEGICVFLDQAVVTTGNPTTDKWIASINWEEYQRP